MASMKKHGLKSRVGTWWKHGEPESAGPSKSPASATAARSSAKSLVVTAGRGACIPRRRKTPKGRFWMGKCEPAGTSMNDRMLSIRLRH
ncbi:unnamed protein product [Miscanthus lutarioriparius]|uniref:Uncharacterized protein n=1 Tax=Miscanthus lutarioriparius TaxID=422564 RepID=A0A811NNW2_9POAL|nr:unnamed protein product [Miscanthus lutarioriparius]CAD6344018.1 unnamed protein product [Miscanthus lutarioriparius]